MNSRAYRWLLHYGMAIGSTVVALLLTLLLEPFLSQVISPFFFVAITLTTWYGGLRPGIVAIILSTLAVHIFLVWPLGNLTNYSFGDLVRLVTFSSVALIIHRLKSDLQKSQRRIDQLNQQLLEENADRLKIALNAAQMGMWDWDLVSEEITWSPEQERLFGLAPGQFDGKYETFKAFVHPDDQTRLNQTVKQALNDGSLYLHEYRIVWADGSIHWVEGRGQASYNKQGQPIRMSGTIMAIDARKQAQRLLTQQLEQQRLVTEITNRIRQSLNLQEILQTTVDEVRKFLQVDRVIIFQFTPDWGGTIAVESVGDEALALIPFDIHDPCIGDRYVEPFQKGLVTAKADIYTADISPCHVEFLAQFQVRANLVVPILKNGELWGLLAAHHCVAPRQWQESEIDLLRQLASQVSIALQQAALFEQVQAELVERKQAEAVLQERESLLRLFAQYAPAGIAMLDREMRYVMASQRWVDEYNLDSVEACIHRSHYDIFPEIPERWRQIHQRCLAGAIEKCDDDLFIRTDGKQQWISWEVRPWHTATGEIGGIVIFSIDVTLRKLAEIELRDRERLFSTLAETLPVVIFRFDQDSHCVYINNYWTVLTGRTIESVAGLDWVEALHPEDRERLINEWLEWSQNSQQQGLYQNEGRLVHANGRDIWYYIQALPEVTAQGETVGFIGVFTDITGRKQAEEALRQSEARLRLAQTASKSAVWDWDMSTNTLTWSPEYYQLYGLEPTVEANYENWLRCIHPDDRERVNQETQQILEDKSSEQRAEFRVVRSDGIRWFLGIGQVFQNNAGKPTRMIGMTIDITQQKQTELALQQFNTELEQRVTERTEELNALNNRLLVAFKEQYQAKQEVEDLYNNAPCGYHSLDTNGTVVQMNDTELNWLGYTRDEVLDKMKFTDLITSDSQPIFHQNFPKFKQQGWVNDLEFQLRHKDGSTRWVNINATAIQDDSGNFVMSRSSVFDISDRKKAEQTQALQAVITRNMSEGICLVRADDATIVYANPKFETMFGYDSGELNGQHVSIINYADESITAEAVNQSIRSAVLQNSAATYEVHNIRKDGTPFWCSATCAAFKHAEYGDVLVAVHQDITERKQAAAALQQQTQQKQLLWNITQTIRQSLDLDITLNSAVAEVRQILGVDRAVVYQFDSNWSGDFIAESVGSEWVTLVNSDVQKVLEDTYLQETQGGRFQNHETFVISDIYTSGLQPCHIELLEQFQAKAYAVAPIFCGKTLWGLLAIYQNNTPRTWQDWEIELLKQIASQLAIALQQANLYNQLQIELQERERAAAILQETERRWRSLLENVQLIVVGLDQSGNVNYANPFFLNLTGYKASEVLGKNWFENFLPSSGHQVVQAVFSEVPTCSAHPYYQNSILTKLGEERFIAWNNTMLQDIDGVVIGTISIGEDITERQKIDQMKQEFISVVSHELRTPLTSIRGSLGLIAGGVYDKKPEKIKEMIAIAARQSDRLVRLVNDILSLRRLESGQVEFKFQHCSAADLIQQSVDVMRSQAEQNQITLSIMPTAAEVWADADAVVQTLTNLLSNAIKFSPPNSTVTLAATPDQSALTPYPGTCFSIQDQGRGIPSDHLETIFGQFRQVDASDARDKGGTGLGLAICRTIVKQHGGRIWVKSVLEQGSTFYFTLPSTQTSSDND